MPAVARETAPSDLAVVVLDTGFVPGAAAAIGQAFPDVHVATARTESGLCGQQQRRLSLALRRGAAWILLLNDDVVVAPDCVSRLLEAAAADERIGLLGPTVYEHGRPTVVQSAGGTLGKDWSARFLAPGEPGWKLSTEPNDVAWLSGCALMARRELCEQAGLLDERFFSYWEEVEWCLRASRAGWRVVHVPSAKAWHKGGLPVDPPPAHVAYYVTRNHLLALRKHRAPLRVWLANLLRLSATLLSWSLRPKWRSRREARTAMWNGVVDFALGRFGQMPTVRSRRHRA